jgi:acetolactate synthase-1/2/3 large subunit
LWREEIEAIGSVLTRDAIVAGDSAAVCYYGLRTNLALHTPGSFLYPTGYGTLGYGLPAAIGAKVAAPDRQVVAVLGDGGVMFTLPELAAAAVEGLALPVIVVDNGGYGQIRTNMERRGYSPLGVDIPSPDFAAAGRALGCHGVTIGGPRHLAEELAKAFLADRPTILHVTERTTA